MFGGNCEGRLETIKNKSFTLSEIEYMGKSRNKNIIKKEISKPSFQSLVVSGY